MAVFLLHVASKKTGNHAGDDKYGNKNPDPLDNFFGVFMVEETHDSYLK